MRIDAETMVNSDASVTTVIEGNQFTTEAPVAMGGTGKHPRATQMAVASMLNCSLSAIKGFCKFRGIPFEGLSMKFSGDYDEGIYKAMRCEIFLPVGFPEKYRDVIPKLFDSCDFKKIIRNLPAIEVCVS